ncbi:MAG: hypothetical protein KAI07_07275 [Deltaproteobacteria bacterium]|nr:hypothetical protein [Deltaproteobacteria bacterium]
MGISEICGWINSKQKRVYKLMREHNLTVKPNTRLIAKRLSERPKPRADKSNQWWGIDMTKVMTDRD